jgi:mannose-6-phosphate isomerase class I
LAELPWGQVAPSSGTGEVWLISDLPGAASVVRDGPFAGSTLRDVVRERGEALLGEAGATQFPLLVKLLDVGEPLSVQVHPNAEVARELGDGDRGKCEAWLVLAVEADGAMLYGLREGVLPADVPGLSAAGTLPEHMVSFQPEVGEGIEIVPGILHGAHGLLALEVQEACDITYRVYDYGRERGELHLAQAQRCLELATGDARGPGGAWSAGRRSLAPRSPFLFEAVQLEAGEVLEIPGGRAGVIVLLEGRLGLGDVELGPTEAAVCPAEWAGEGRALERVRLGYAVAAASPGS